jgi:hypothetical protein
MGGYEYTSCTGYCCGPYKMKDDFEMWTYDPSADDWQFIKAFGSGEVRPHFMGRRGPQTAPVAADTSDFVVALACTTYYSGRYFTEQRSYTMQCDPTQTDAAGTQARGVGPGTITGRSGPYDPHWYEQDVPRVHPDSIEALLKNMPTNTWIRMSPPKEPSRAQNIVWGTKVYDPDRDMVMAFCGGHSANAGSEIQEYYPHYDRWDIGFYPDWMLEWTYSAGFGPGHYTFNNRPFMTGHTYDSYCYATNLKKLVLVKAKYTYTYDGDRHDWDSLRIRNHPMMGTDYHCISVTATPHGAFCWTHQYGRSSGITPYYFFLLDPDTKQWSRITPTGDAIPRYYTEQGGTVYDSKQDRIILNSYGDMYQYKFSDNSFTRLNPSGSGLSGYQREAVYLPAQDKILYQGNKIYDCASNSLSGISISGGGGSTNSTGYSYDANRDLVWNVEIYHEVYVLRVAGGYDPNSLPPITRIESNSPALPDLFIAKPNPFKPMTSIHFTVPADNIYSLKIYDVSGRLVKILVNKQRLSMGYCSRTWKGQAGSGIYYAMLKGPGMQKTLKLLRLK